MRQNHQIRLSELLPGKTFHWLEFFVRNIPNRRLESLVIPQSQCFQYFYNNLNISQISKS